MADYFDSAAANNDQAKADTLKAVATQGSAAKQAFTDAQATNQAAMQSAVKSALATAASRNAPGGNVQALQDQNAAPFNERAASLGASQANRLASMDQSGQAASRYFDETKAALPALKANVAGRVAGLQAAAAQRAQDAQMRETLMGLQTQKAQAELDNTNAKGAAAAAKGNTPAQIIKGMGGADLANRILQGQSQGVHDQSVADNVAAYHAPPSPSQKAGHFDMGGVGAPDQIGPDEATAMAEQANGLPPGYAAQLANQQGATATGLRSGGVYKEAASAYGTALGQVGKNGGAKSAAEVEAGIINKYGNVGRQAIADMKGANSTYQAP